MTFQQIDGQGNSLTAQTNRESREAILHDKDAHAAITTAVLRINSDPAHAKEIGKELAATLDQSSHNGTTTLVSSGNNTITTDTSSLKPYSGREVIERCMYEAEEASGGKEQQDRVYADELIRILIDLLPPETSISLTTNTSIFTQSANPNTDSQFNISASAQEGYNLSEMSFSSRTTTSSTSNVDAAEVATQEGKLFPLNA